MKTPTNRQFDFMHAVIRNAYFEGITKEDFLAWSAVIWDGHEDGRKQVKEEAPDSAGGSDAP